MDVIKKIGQKEPEEEYIPKQVVDKYLDSLRRQREVQLNEVEKERLKKAIAVYQKERERKYLWGMKTKLKDDKKRKLMEALKKKKKVKILTNQKKMLSRRSLLDNKKDEFKKKKTDILRNHGRFLD